MMKFLDDIASYVIRLDRKKFLIYASSILAGTLVAALAITYYIYRTENNLILHITNLQKLSTEAQKTAFTYETIQTRKHLIIEALDEQKNFDLKSFFASFCKENNLKPESSWSATVTPIEGNELLEEVSLQANFKNFSMQKLVNFIETLHQKELVYIKSITIKKDTENINNNSLAFDISVATLAYKQEKGE